MSVKVQALNKGDGRKTFLVVGTRLHDDPERGTEDDATELAVLVECARDAVAEQARHSKESLFTLLSRLFTKAKDADIEIAVTDALLQDSYLLPRCKGCGRLLHTGDC